MDSTFYQPRLHVYQDGEAVARAFADHLVKRLDAKKEGPFFWALSGGSTPKLLFKLLAEDYADRIDWSRIHFFWGDDRLVPYSSPESNYGEVQKLLFDHVPVKENQIHAIDPSLEPDAAARDYGEKMMQLLPSNSDGLPILDLNMLGMGGDGHTASIFPDQMDLLQDERICAVARHPESGQLRVTMTGPVINASDEVVFLVTGASKTERVAEILNQKHSAKAYPVAHVNPPAGELHWFLDEAAAAGVAR